MSFVEVLMHTSASLHFRATADIAASNDGEEEIQEPITVLFRRYCRNAMLQ
jgi:hypothetical protein